MSLMNKYKYIITFAFIIVTLLLINQCSTTREVRRTLADRTKELNNVSKKYIALLEAKQSSDTVIVQGAEHTETHYIIKSVHDTIIDSVVYKVYQDSLRSEDLTLDLYAVASDLQVMRYNYHVNQKVITNNHIVTVIDTLRIIQTKRHLYGASEVGLNSINAGLIYVGKKRLGVSAKINWYDNERFYTLGVLYKIF